MMDYNELPNQELTLGDPFRSGRKFRPLFPRPYLPPSNHNINTTCFSGFHGSTKHLPSLNNTTRNQHHLGVMGPEEGKVETVGTNQVMVSSRWNPTPEQLRALEDLYRRGTRTPSADQIQHITAQLRRYGKIEGKNVFYWFQNHKARERQKRRRQLQLPPPPPPQQSSENIGSDEGNKIGIETEAKSCKWTPSSLNKESDPPISAAAVDVTKADTTTTSEHEWIQLFHKKTSQSFQHHHITNDNNHNNITNIKNLFLAEPKNATWQTHNNTNTNTMVQQPSSCSIACCYPCTTPPLFPFSLFSSITSKDVERSPEKQAADDGDIVIETTPQSPTLQLFPVALVREDHDQVHHHNVASSLDDDDDHMMNKVEDEKNREKNSSICLTSTSNECNNPFPYYQFI